MRPDHSAEAEVTRGLGWRGGQGLRCVQPWTQALSRGMWKLQEGLTRERQDQLMECGEAGGERPVRRSREQGWEEPSGGA